LEQAYTTKVGGGLIATEMQSGKIAHQGLTGMRLEPIGDAPSINRTSALEKARTGQRTMSRASGAGGLRDAGTAVSRPAVLKPLNPRAAKQYMQVSVRGRNAMRLCLMH